MPFLTISDPESIKTKAALGSPLLEAYNWNSFSMDSTGRLLVIVHYQLSGISYSALSPYLWYFTQMCRIILLPLVRTKSASLEPVSINIPC